MTYYIISKIELEGENNLKYTDIGYADNMDVVNEINEQYDSTLGAFIGENRTKLQIGEVLISTFFETTQYVNEARTEIDNVEDLGLTKITNIIEL
tara:strand:+ start:71 stop:355 length:285 start_codon:yes stop_codon:yes gene_type:complete